MVEEQGDDLDVTFSCVDGCQKCGKWILEFSEFFSHKISGFEKLKQNLTFDYTDYKRVTIRIFLDALHGLQTEEIGLIEALELMRFLCFEGKTGQFTYQHASKLSG